MKYIRMELWQVARVTKVRRYYKSLFIIFSSELIHADMAKSALAQATLNWPGTVEATVTAAGSIDIDALAIYGRSTSLEGLMADPTDVMRIGAPDSIALLMDPPDPPRFDKTR